MTCHTAGITNADSLAVSENAENHNPTNKAQRKVTVTAKTEIPPPPHPYDGNSNALFATVTNAALTAHGAALFWGSGHRDLVLDVHARRTTSEVSN